MATVLKRPMFRLGGPSSDGVGITSGLRRYGFADPEKKSPELVEAEQAILNPEKPKYGFKELISDAYRTSKGAVTGMDWLENAADLALERGDEEKVKAEAKKLSDLELLQKIRADKLARQDKAFDQKTTLRSLDQVDEQIAQSQADFEWKKNIDNQKLEIEREKLAAGDPTIKARLDLLEDVMVSMDEWRKANPGKSVLDWMQGGDMFKIDAKIRNANPAFPGIHRILEEIESELRAFDPGAYDDNELTLPKDKWEVENERRRLIQSKLGSYLSFTGENIEILDETWKGARGGRPGYNMGMGPVTDQQTDMSMTENIDTPQGDMSMTENIDVNQIAQAQGFPSQTLPSDDPYVLLRARLPEEISDDVVRLIAYNPDAFADFADIETQDDVIAFNKKWGVELVVNTDGMSGAIA